MLYSLAGVLVLCGPADCGWPGLLGALCSANIVGTLINRNNLK